MTHRNDAKEEAEKKEIPPSPPIGRKGEEEKAHFHTHGSACACARETELPVQPPWPGETPPDGFVNPKIIPTIGVALWHAHRNLGVQDPAFVHEWYEDMQGRFWCDDKGDPIRNWGMMLTVWARNRARFAALRAVPKTSAGCADRGFHPKRPDNWVGMDEEARKEFLRGLE